ncbi:MAG: hypothetical protein PHC66_02220 [Candidatus Nanoarchaeia archaeon]|nr:hypothetical protein [Candidatus Nanoarchaeia archaeon]
MIHPFTKQAVEITATEFPASLSFRPYDLVYSINGEKIASIESFSGIVGSIGANESLKVVIERETFPYSYRQFAHNYITNTDDNPIAFYAKENSFSNLKFNAQLQESNRFTIKTSDPDNTIDVLSKRFKTARVSDYIFQKQGSDVVLYTSAGRDISKLIESNGVFEAKIGENVLFTDREIAKYCISGVDCMVHTYAVLNQSQESKEVLWKFGFETQITDEAAARFPELAKSLSILKCEYERCELNDSIKFYLDGETVGFETIYAIDKGKNLSSVFIGGEEKTKDDAFNTLHFVQAVLQGRTDAEIQSVDLAAPLTGEKTVFVFFAVIAGILFINALLNLIIFRDIKTAAVALLLGASEIIVIIGTISGLKMTITLLTMAAIVLVSVMNLVYQNYSVFWIKKEGIIMRKIAELNSRLNKIFWMAIGITTVVTLLWADLGTPILIYLMLEVIITKGLLFRTIKAKE